MNQQPDEDRTWLLEPPGPGTVQIHIAVGEGVELVESQRAAIEALVSSFYESEVAGYASAVPRCRPLRCEPRTTSCAVDFCGSFSCEVGVMAG